MRTKLAHEVEVAGVMEGGWHATIFPLLDRLSLQSSRFIQATLSLIRQKVLNLLQINPMIYQPDFICSDSLSV